MRLEETLEYRCYLCLAYVCWALRGDGLGSDGDYDDSSYFKAHIEELHGADLDRVFRSQDVVGVYGEQRWAFIDPENGYKGDDLEARLFRDLDHDVYYLVHRPTETFVDNINNALTAIGAGVPDKFKQAAQLMELVRPEFRDKVVLTGLSLGGALAAYAAVQASWPVRAVVFDPLGLNRNMMGRRGWRPFGNLETLSDRYRHLDGHVEWFYFAGSWVAKLNVDRHLSSVGLVTELPPDPVRLANNPDTHDFRHARFGLHQLWHKEGWRGSEVVVSGKVDETPIGDISLDRRDSAILVSEEIQRSSGARASALCAALEAAAIPLAVQYFPASEAEIASYRTVPVNAVARRLLVDLVPLVNPTEPTLFRVVLPRGADLARAAGGGFRGFTTRGGGKIAAHAVLKPVGVGGAALPAWPVLAVVGTLMAVDMLAQREQRAHQRRVEASLGRMEERAYLDRIKDQRTADAQLTRTISLILDGEAPPLELALKGADDVFHRAQVWLEKYDGVVGRIVGGDGKVAYKELERSLGDDLPDFFRELHLAHSAIAIRRKALVADAAASALADPTNPYTVFRRSLESKAREIEGADRIAVDLSGSLSNIRVRGGFPDSPQKVRGQEHWVRSMAYPPTMDSEATVQFLLRTSGEIVQVLPPLHEGS